MGEGAKKLSRVEFYGPEGMLRLMLPLKCAVPTCHGPQPRGMAQVAPV